MWSGFIGVLIFSLTLPATRFAVDGLDPAWVSLGRGVVAGAIALPILLLSHQPRPSRRQLKSLAAISFGVVFGFPLFTSLAMRLTDASHGAVIIGLLPMVTAIISARVSHEKLSRRFWICAGLGALVVATYALSQSKGALNWGDSFLVLAVLTSAVGYAFGGRLSQELGGWQTIAWALVLSLPLTLPPWLWLSWGQDFSQVKWQAWTGFAYVSLFSQFIGFLFWYGGMVKAGVARVSQVQLLQLFLTLIFSAMINHEQVELATWAVASVIVGLVWAIRRP